MSAKYIEKAFLYFITLSLLLHGIVITIIVLMPDKKRVANPQPYYVDLMDSPLPTKLPKGDMRKAELPKGKAVKAERDEDDLTYAPRQVLRGSPPPSAKQDRDTPRIKASPPASDMKKEILSGEAVGNPRKKLPELAKLFPSSDQMKSLEDRYRKELGVSLDGGFSESLDSEDMMLASFLSRFVKAVNQNMPYYSGEQQRQILADTKGLVSWRVIIVFNRNGGIEDLRYKSTGSKELDDSLERAIHSVGPLGSLPKSYEKNLLKVPFIYSLTNRRLAG